MSLGKLFTTRLGRDKCERDMETSFFCAYPSPWPLNVRALVCCCFVLYSGLFNTMFDAALRYRSRTRLGETLFMVFLWTRNLFIYFTEASQTLGNKRYHRSTCHSPFYPRTIYDCVIELTVRGGRD